MRGVSPVGIYGVAVAPDATAGEDCVAVTTEGSWSTPSWPADRSLARVVCRSVFIGDAVRLRMSVGLNPCSRCIQV